MAHAARILLVTNQPTPSPVQALHMAHSTCKLFMENDPMRVVRAWAEHAPDIFVFDVDLPEARLTELIARLREEAVIPILVLTSNRGEEFALKAYQAGADECILKPVTPSMLEARLKVWCRRTGTANLELLEPLRVGNVRLIPLERKLILDDGKKIHLTNLEMRLMYSLMGKPGRAVTYDELCNRMWGEMAEANKSTLKNMVYRLRQKIEQDPADPRYVFTVPGVGYQFGQES